MIQGYHIGMKKRNDLDAQLVDAKIHQNGDLSLLQSRFTSIEDWSEANKSVSRTASVKSESSTPVANKTNEVDKRNLKKELIVGGVAAATVGGASALLGGVAQAGAVSTTMGAQATSAATGIGAQATQGAAMIGAQAAAVGAQPVTANALQKNVIGNSPENGAKSINLNKGADLQQQKMTISPDNLNKQEFAGLDSSADPVEVSSLVIRQMSDPKSIGSLNSMSKGDVETIKSILNSSSRLSTDAIENRRSTKLLSEPSHIESLEDTVSSLVMSNISQAMSISTASNEQIPAEASTSTLQSIESEKPNSTKSVLSGLSKASTVSTTQSGELLAEASNITDQSGKSILSRDSNISKTSAISTSTNADVQAESSKSTLRSMESKIASSIKTVLSGISNAFSSSTVSNQGLQAEASTSTRRSSVSKKTTSVESIHTNSQSSSVLGIAVEKPSDATIAFSKTSLQSDKSKSLLRVSNQSIVNHSEISLSIRDSKASLSNSPSAVSQPSNEFITAKNSVASSISGGNSVASANEKISELSISDQTKRKNRCCIIQ